MIYGRRMFGRIGLLDLMMMHAWIGPTDARLHYATKKKHVVRIGVVNWVIGPISIGSFENGLH